MFAENQSGNLRRRGLQPLGDQRAEADRVQQRSQAEHAAGRQLQLLRGEIRQHVDRVRHDQHDRFGLCPAFWISLKMPRNSSTLRLIRSSRLSSGLRRRPAVMQIRSASGICS